MLEGYLPILVPVRTHRAYANVLTATRSWNVLCSELMLAHNGWAMSGHRLIGMPHVLQALSASYKVLFSVQELTIGETNSRWGFPLY